LDFKKTFVPMMKWLIIHIIVTIASHYGWLIKHLDVKTLFLNDDLKKKVYTVQAQGITI
jgi:hypothetical protein